jgi:hypothetical protein
MPVRTIPRSSTQYYLVAFDRDGAERTDDPDRPGGRLSDAIVQTIASDPITDVFLISHGWKGDLRAAVEQYDAWVGAMEGCANDKQRMLKKYPNFRPLRIGLHWPSQPWGDEEFGTLGDSFEPAAAEPVEEMVEIYVRRLGESPIIRASLRTLFEEARRNAAVDKLTPAAREAYQQLDSALGLGESGEGAPPGADRERFDPDRAFINAKVETQSFGLGLDLGGILGPLRQLSFWKMKQRARAVGEGGMHNFLAAMMRTTAARGTRFHLMGHSFGCIVVSAALGGPGGVSTLPRPTASLALVQGAVSLWAYCSEIPFRTGTPGYFHRIVADRKVAGPIMTTRSRFDAAVGRFYPLGAGVAGQADFDADYLANLPEYGGLGSFGIRGLAENAEDLEMKPVNDAYDFKPNQVYNLEASRYICHGDGASGAHSDIAGAEVAHAIWSAALS